MRPFSTTRRLLLKCIAAGSAFLATRASGQPGGLRPPRLDEERTSAGTDHAVIYWSDTVEAAVDIRLMAVDGEARWSVADAENGERLSGLRPNGLYQVTVRSRTEEEVSSWSVPHLLRCTVPSPHLEGLVLVGSGGAMVSWKIGFDDKVKEPERIGYVVERIRPDVAPVVLASMETGMTGAALDAGHINGDSYRLAAVSPGVTPESPSRRSDEVALPVAIAADVRRPASRSSILNPLHHGRVGLTR